jgi:hypothetical protein
VFGPFHDPLGGVFCGHEKPDNTRPNCIVQNVARVEIEGKWTFINDSVGFLRKKVVIKYPPFHHSVRKPRVTKEFSCNRSGVVGSDDGFHPHA